MPGVEGVIATIAAEDTVALAQHAAAAEYLTQLRAAISVITVNLSNQSTGAAAQQTSTLPALVRAQIDAAIAAVTARVATISSHLDAIGRTATANAITAAKSTTDLADLSKQLLTARVARASNAATKGAHGEQLMFDHLSRALPRREGYTIERTSGTSRACDLLIKRNGRCDVRIEVKNFTSPVPTKDVDKFERDLMATSAHGIMCSIGSKIVQHGDVGMSQLPNGRLAFYLSNVGEDVDVVVTFLHVIYKLDAITAATTDNAAAAVPGLKLPESTVRLAQDLLKGHVEKTRAMKANLNECLRLLGEMNLDALATILGGGAPTAATKGQGSKLPTQPPPPAQPAPASVGSIVTTPEGAVTATMSAPGIVRNAAATKMGAGTVTSSVEVSNATNAAAHVCIECNMTFPSAALKRRRAASIAAEKKAEKTCADCGKHFISPNNLATHRYWRHNPDRTSPAS